MILDRAAAPSAHAPPREFSVGSVLSVRGSEATIGIMRRGGAPDDAGRTTVGRFLAIASKTSTLIGFVTEVSVEVPDIVRQQGSVATAKLDLMGELKTGPQGPRFNRGITDYPMIGDPAVTVSSATLSVIFGARGTRSITIGKLQQDERLPACIQVDEMLSRHFAVFGTTGVGKSSGVATILRETLKARPNLRIFVLDGHNEYGQCFSEWSQVINPGNLKLPFWLFNFEEIVDVIFGGRPGFEEALEILAEVIPIAKFMYAQYQTTPARPGLKKTDPKSAGFTIDTPVPYRLADLLALIDERMGKLENRSSRMKYFKLMTRIETISNDPRYNFMFENANVGGDTMADTICQLFRVTPAGKPMTVMQLGGFPAEVVDAVVSVLGRMAFEFGLWSEGAFPLLFVCEEAHRYASADRALGFGPTRRALSRIAKEGRKCGVFLALVSQRPAELDPTIISQCSTLFVMRMANDRDQDIVRSAVSDAAASLVSLVPSLGNREVLAFGEGVALPARMIFGALPANLIPSSDAVRNTHADADPPEPRDMVEAIIARWRGASLAKQAFGEEAPPLAASADNGALPPRSPAAPAAVRSRILKENASWGERSGP